jgi:hypothetical protein
LIEEEKVPYAKQPLGTMQQTFKILIKLFTLGVLDPFSLKYY